MGIDPGITTVGKRASSFLTTRAFVVHGRRHGAMGTHSNGHPQGWPSLLTHVPSACSPYGHAPIPVAYQRDRLGSRRGSRGLASLTVKVRPASSLPWSP
jgi:hypothetical protein